MRKNRAGNMLLITVFSIKLSIDFSFCLDEDTYLSCICPSVTLPIVDSLCDRTSSTSFLPSLSPFHSISRLLSNLSPSLNSHPAPSLLPSIPSQVVASCAQTMGMHVIGYDPVMTPDAFLEVSTIPFPLDVFVRNAMHCNYVVLTVNSLRFIL